MMFFAGFLHKYKLEKISYQGYAVSGKKIIGSTFKLPGFPSLPAQ
jgi:hypothetical protein